MSNFPYDFVNVDTNERTDRRSERSSCIATTVPDAKADGSFEESFLQDARLLMSAETSFTAAFALSKDLHARITVAPFEASK
jgi:hypothetical protein